MAHRPIQLSPQKGQQEGRYEQTGGEYRGGGRKKGREVHSLPTHCCISSKPAKLLERISYTHCLHSPPADQSLKASHQVGCREDHDEEVSERISPTQGLLYIRGHHALVPGCSAPQECLDRTSISAHHQVGSSSVTPSSSPLSPVNDHANLPAPSLILSLPETQSSSQSLQRYASCIRFHFYT